MASHTPPGVALRILLVEDDDGDAEAISAQLGTHGRGRVTVRRVPTMAAAEHALATDDVHAVLLDIALPDAQGADTVARAIAAAPEVPVVVLTARPEDAAARETLRRGAQDLLVKGEASGPDVLRRVEYAVERQRLLDRITELEAEIDEMREQQVLERLAATHELAPSPAGILGGRALRDGAPEVFARSVRRYAQYLDRAWRERRMDVPTDEADGILDAVAEDLARAGAGPRDVVDVHRDALRRDEDLTPGSRRARRDEARWALVRLMGELTDRYRHGGERRGWDAAP